MSRHYSLGCLGRLGFIDTLHIRTIDTKTSVCLEVHIQILEESKKENMA